MKKIICKECGSEEVRVTESLNPNDDNSIRKFFTDAYPDKLQGYCSECEKNTALEIAPDNNEDPWRCNECGSLEIQRMGWVNPNTLQFIGYIECDSTEGEEDADNWCEDCQNHTVQINESELLRKIEDFWQGGDSDQKEEITGIFRSDYSDDDIGSAKFNEDCQRHWETLTKDQKFKIWQTNIYNYI